MKKNKYINGKDFGAEQFIKMNIWALKKSSIKMKLKPIFMMKEYHQKKSVFSICDCA